MTALAGHLDRLTRGVAANMRSEMRTVWPGGRGEGKWTRQDLVGHLIDSAANNHQRIVRALLVDALEWPGYDQVGMVRVQRFSELEPETLIGLWEGYNLLLAHVIGGIPEHKLATPCAIGGAPAMTLAHLVEDYVAHMEHHLRQILEGVGEPPLYSGMAWPPADARRQWPE